MKPFQTIPPFVELSCWRRQQIGLQGVSHPSEAEVVIVKMRGVPPMSFDMTATGRAQFDALIDAVTVAFELGRLDVIDTVRGIFEQPAAR